MLTLALFSRGYSCAYVMLVLMFTRRETNLSFSLCLAYAYVGTISTGLFLCLRYACAYAYAS